MLQVFGADENEIIIPDRFDAVPDYAFHTFPVLHEIQFEFPVLVERVGKLRLMPFHDMETVQVGKFRDFCKYVVVHLDKKAPVPRLQSAGPHPDAAMQTEQR